ncbi:MAG: helix-turn-helix domain-containing protein [Planctomycetota bacterium]|jgi:transcriptional regulator with XRE-family HTH domain
MTTFGERIKQARASLTPMPPEAEVARKVGVDPSKFNRWTASSKEPPVPINVYFKLAEVLQVALMELLPDEMRDSMTLETVLGGNGHPRETPGAIDHSKVEHMIDRIESAVIALQHDIAILRHLARGNTK